MCTGFDSGNYLSKFSMFRLVSSAKGSERNEEVCEVRRLENDLKMEFVN